MSQQFTEAQWGQKFAEQEQKLAALELKNAAREKQATIQGFAAQMESWSEKVDSGGQQFTMRCDPTAIPFYAKSAMHIPNDQIEQFFTEAVTSCNKVYDEAAPVTTADGATPPGGSTAQNFAETFKDNDKMAARFADTNPDKADNEYAANKFEEAFALLPPGRRAEWDSKGGLSAFLSAKFTELDHAVPGVS